MFSVSPSYHRPKNRKWDRFIFAGVSPAFRDRTLWLHNGLAMADAAETLTLLNFGFGVDYRIKTGKVLGFEVRDRLHTAETDRQYLESRFGFLFC